MKTETCKLYSRDFWIFLPKIIIHNSELYRFKVGAFFWDTVYEWIMWMDFDPLWVTCFQQKSEAAAVNIGIP